MVNVSTPAIRVFLIDDHEIFLTGLRSLIQNEPGLIVAGQAVNRAEAIDVARYEPDVILLDIGLGNENSLDFLPDLIQAAKGARVLVLTGITDPELHLRAVRLGAMGVLLKTESASRLFIAIRKVHSGEVWLTRSMMATMIAQANIVDRDPEAAKMATLTSRERDVIALVAQGRKNKQIGEALFISEKTVGHYMTSIFDKLGVTDRLELLIYAYQHKLAEIVPPSRAAGQTNVKLFSARR